jgi:SAM-dependent methyltransferase
VAFNPDLLEYSAPYDATQMMSPSFREYAHGIAKYLVEKYDLHSRRIIDIGCGDAAFLQLVCELGDNTGIGFDPGWREDVHGKTPKAVTIIPDQYSERYSGYQGDLICCRHVLEHIHDPKLFLHDLGNLTHIAVPVFFFEVPNVSWSLRALAFWDIYYEHCMYFSRASLSHLFAHSEFSVLEVREGFGGQYVWIESLFRGSRQSRGFELDVSEGVQKLAREVDDFSKNYRRMIDRLALATKALTEQGRVVLWGAGAKAVAFLNLLGIMPDQIEVVVDVNPRKRGTFVSCTGQEVVPPASLLEYKPDVILVMNPEYLSEIKEMASELGIAARMMVVGEEC